MLRAAVGTTRRESGTLSGRRRQGVFDRTRARGCTSAYASSVERCKTSIAGMRPAGLLPVFLMQREWEFSPSCGHVFNDAFSTSPPHGRRPP